MVGLLEGAIAKAIYDGFKGKLLKGTLRRTAPDSAAGLDKLGDPQDVEKLSWRCQGFVDNYSEAFRTQHQIPDTDAKVCIFAKSLPAGVRPQKDDIVEIPTGTSYQLRSPIMTDPATALWECRGTLLDADSGDCRARAF